MWERRDVQNLSTEARPVRIAYLIDPARVDHDHLDAITNEAFGRWGGRRTLLAPISEGRILSGYDHWLEHFDADIICSFEALSDEYIIEINERYAPLHLKKIELEGTASNIVQLPIKCLSSLSVLSDLSKTHVNPIIGPRPRKILSRHPNSEEVPFFKRNFGFLMDVFNTGTQGSWDTDTYTSVSLIDDSALSDGRIGKERKAVHKTSIEDVFDAFDHIPELLTCAQLAEIYAPYNYAEYSGPRPSFTLVVGDTVQDRLLAWNMHLLVAQNLGSHISSLHLSSEEISDDFLEKVLRIIRKNAFYTDNQVIIELSSVSLDADTLEEIAKKLRTLDGCWTPIRVVKREDLESIAPSPDSFKQSGWTFGGWLDTQQGSASLEYRGNRSVIPVATPHHTIGFHPASRLNEGSWMLDTKIDRDVDHCGISNVRHEWLFPRNLRIDRAFEVIFEPSNFTSENTRINKKSKLSFSIDKQITRATMSFPSDTTAFFMALTCDFEWMPFEHGQRHGLLSRRRYTEAAISNAGRSLSGVLTLFEDLPTALSVLFHRFWRAEFISLGATTTEITDKDVADTSKKMNAVLGTNAQLQLASDSDKIRELLQKIEPIFRGKSNPKRFRYYGQLKNEWDGYVAKDDRRRFKPKPDDPHDCFLPERSSSRDTYAPGKWYDTELNFDQSIQMLCQTDVLFQGREWKCPSCYNRNWVGIRDLSNTLTCVICKETAPAPVAGDWQFRLNPFIIDSYRNGLEPVLWAILYLHRKARKSFYFAPSINVWDTNDQKSEIDLVAVVDGRTYLVDAKNSTRKLNDPSNIGKTKRDVSYINPDVVLFSVGRLEENDTYEVFLTKLRQKHTLSCEIELTVVDPGQMETQPFLPS